MKIRVFYEDTDIGGIVYHSKFFNFCERARSELLFKKGIMPFDFQNKSGFVVKELNANFLKSATLGDVLEVKTQLLSATKVSIKLLQEIFKEKEKIFSMEIVLVYLKNNKISKIPEAILKVF